MIIYSSYTTAAVQGFNQYGAIAEDRITTERVGLDDYVVSIDGEQVGKVGRCTDEDGNKLEWWAIKAYDHRMKRRILAARFDVTGLSQKQLECLMGEVEAQAEASDPDDDSPGHPDVKVHLEVTES